MTGDQSSSAPAEDSHGRRSVDGAGDGGGSGSDTCGNDPAMRFDILRPSPGSSGSVVGPRLGRLVFPGRAAIQTPNFLASTSRGCVPHLTPDNVLRHTCLGGGFFALEDFIERRSDHPIYSVPAPPPSCAAAATPLHAFAAFPPSLPTILAPRRCPPVASPSGNGHDHVSVYTSTGFRPLTVASYARAVRALRPDAVVALADVGVAPGATPKRLLRAVERTEEWVGRLLTELEEGGQGGERPDDGGSGGSSSSSSSSSGQAAATAAATAVFVPLPTVPYPLQWEYMTNLADDLAGRISGLALYDASLAPELANHERLLGLPRLSLEAAASPHHILHQLSLGTDLVTASLVNVSSDAGVALRFVFPAPEPDPKSGRALPLGVDMWSPEHSVSLEPLLEGCECYTCASHHRAYVHHLLDAKEMLGWILLQIHNLHVTTNFFAAVRAALAEGDEGAGAFEAECGRFAQAYEPEMPVGTGTRPRARGYHFKSEADQMPINRPAWSKYEPVPARGEKGVVIE